MLTLLACAFDSVAVIVTDEPSGTGFGDAERDTVGGACGVPVVDAQLLLLFDDAQKSWTSTS